jgi:beta-phosphoglucomutase-like phosphatase (HAD superfamily)
MSYRSLTTALVAAAPAGVFGAVVAGDDVTFGKPHPESYLLAAAQLGVDVRRCVAIEDSPPGIASALAAGARTIGIEVVVPVPPQPGLSRIGSLTELTLADLGRIAQGAIVDRIASRG